VQVQVQSHTYVGAEVQQVEGCRCRYGGAEVLKRCSAGADAGSEVQRCRGAEAQRCCIGA
jgi:hypothetical protein